MARPSPAETRCWRCASETASSPGRGPASGADSRHAWTLGKGGLGVTSLCRSGSRRSRGVAGPLRYSRAYDDLLLDAPCLHHLLQHHPSTLTALSSIKQSGEYLINPNVNISVRSSSSSCALSMLPRIHGGIIFYSVAERIVMISVSLFSSHSRVSKHLKITPRKPLGPPHSRPRYQKLHYSRQ